MINVKQHQEKIIREAFAQELLPPPYIWLDEYADQYRYVPEASSENAGQWRTSLVPHTREIMRAISPQDPCQNVVWMKGSQVAATEVAINSICYRIQISPCPQLYMQTTDGAIQLFSKQRLTTTFDAMPGVQEKLDKSLNVTKKKEISDTLHLKTYVGGILILAGANSTTQVRSFPAPVMYIDEWDDYKGNLKGQGDIAELAIRRAASYKNKKIFKFSSPTLDETSKIKPAFLRGDRRFRFAVCPECGHKGVIIFSKTEKRDLEIYETLNIDDCFQIVWENDDPKTTGCACPSCSVVLKEHHKNDMFADENGCEWRVTNEDGGYPSFHISSFYSPKFTWAEAVDLYITAVKENDLNKFIVFVNTVLGETYKVDFAQFKADYFLDKLEDYNYVPAVVKSLTAGGDVQEDRIELMVIGWGEREENWNIEYKVFMGDTNKPQVWRELDNYLGQPFKKQDGGSIPIAMTFLDSNFRSSKVYNFCKTRTHRGIYPIRGDGKWGKGLFKFPKRANDYGVKVCTLYVSELKIKVNSLLKDNMCHFPRKECYNEDFFSMLTAEKLIRTTVNGLPAVKWDAEGKRNEALDCIVYATGAFIMLNPQVDYTEEEMPQKNIRTTYSQNRQRKVKPKYKVHSRGVR